MVNRDSLTWHMHNGISWGILVPGELVCSNSPVTRTFIDFFESTRVDFLTIKRRREDLFKSMRRVCIKYVLFCVFLLVRQLFFETKYSQAIFPASLQPKLVQPLCLYRLSIFPTRNLQKSRIQLLYLDHLRRTPHRTPFSWFLSPAWRWGHVSCFSSWDQTIQVICLTWGLSNRTWSTNSMK